MARVKAWSWGERNVTAITGDLVGHVEKVVEHEELEEFKDEVVFMKRIGVIAMSVTQVQRVKDVAKNLKQDLIITTGTSSSLAKSFIVPKRYGGLMVNGTFAEWDDLPIELTIKVHNEVLKNLPQGYDMYYKANFHNELSWAYVNQENYEEFIPKFYSTVGMYFTVVDFDCSAIISFLYGLSEAGAKALVDNKALHIAMRFHGDEIQDYVISGTFEWREACKEMNQRLDVARIPWIYHAREQDMITHLEWEIEVASLTGGGELRIIKEVFQQAPLSL